MAQRRAPVKQRATSAAPTEDFDFLASQQSSGSDDQACVGLPSFLYALSSLHILISISLGSIQVAIAHQLMGM
jgi:hypothetical protein